MAQNDGAENDENMAQNGGAGIGEIKMAWFCGGLGRNIADDTPSSGNGDPE